ncbi:MAG: alpha/beta hydrolase, partial [Novosphingobium sp.]|nr:alpha/beta hydrolase [Novosphingobium sp.]
LWTDPQQRAASQYMRAFRDPANDALVREHGLAALLLKALNWERSSALEDAERIAMFKDWSNPDTAFAMLNWYRASSIAVPPLDAPLTLPEGYKDAPLPPLAIPTLVIWAMDDIALPPCNLEGMDKLVTDLTVQPIHDCGHFVPWEAPDKVNAALDRFLV